ncbi:MAG: hypothetical protein IKQ94_08160 [Bacteroidales bacterium]|nr:hypothetical protein [Bacteroidales bacterium]
MKKENERALDRLRRIKELKDKYADVSIEDLDKQTLAEINRLAEGRSPREKKSENKISGENSANSAKIHSRNANQKDKLDVDCIRAEKERLEKQIIQTKEQLRQVRERNAEQLRQAIERKKLDEKKYDIKVKEAHLKGRKIRDFFRRLIN